VPTQKKPRTSTPTARKDRSKTVTTTAEAPALPEVKVGQVWADNDPRSDGRTVKVIAVNQTKAVCEVLTDGANTRRSQVGRITRIGLHRFKDTASGYKLVKKTRAKR